MDRLPTGAKVEAAQRYAKHDIAQWKWFYSVTRDKALAVKTKYPAFTWNNLPPKVKTGLLEDVNQSLRDNEVPEIDMNLLWWRMSQVYRDLRAPSGSAGEAAGSREDGVPAPRTDEALQPGSKSNAFDPIRDALLHS